MWRNAMEALFTMLVTMLVAGHGADQPASWSFWGGNYGCGGDLECIHCTPAQAQSKCSGGGRGGGRGGGAIYMDTFGTNVTCARTRTIGPPASFIGNFSCCDQLLGPTTYNLTNCFFCAGDVDCVGGGSVVHAKNS